MLDYDTFPLPKMLFLKLRIEKLLRALGLLVDCFKRGVCNWQQGYKERGDTALRMMDLTNTENNLSYARIMWDPQ